MEINLVAENLHSVRLAVPRGFLRHAFAAYAG